MLNNGNILVLTNFAQESLGALNRGCRLAERLNADLHLLHVTPTLAKIECGRNLSLQLTQLKSLEHGIREKLLAEQKNSVSFPIVTHLKESVFDPVAVICKFIEEYQVQLIVLGRNAHQRLLEQALRDTAIVRSGACMLLVTSLS
jgi:nucleotide-binding universal stress UspA family protein